MNDGMKVRIEKNVLYIEMTLGQPRASMSGKTIVIASTQGNHATACVVDGKPLIVGLNAYIAK